MRFGLRLGLRLGLFGGSFNPPHRAHRALAAAAVQQLQLDELVVMPAGQPWQKQGQPLAAGVHRLAMLGLQLQGLERVRVSSWEIDRPEASVSADTLVALQAQQPGQWFLVIGQDQYARLSTWRRVDALLAACTLAVVQRGEQPIQADPALPPHRRETLLMPPDVISASGVRAAVAAGADISPMVGNDVARYIAQHSLYGA
jgi:nicotinate-nucleotide adenylyltransferase